MGTRTQISWADSTFNPWIGCAKKSEACRFCYAETYADRWRKDEGLWKGNRARTSADTWRKPRQWNRKAAANGTRPRVFCASLADVFEDHPALPEWRSDLWQLIRDTPHLIWLLLTKRPENIRAMLPDDWGRGYHNVWLGTTVENQARADERIWRLLATPAALHFLSVEPMLGPIDLNGLLREPCDQGCGTDVTCSALTASTTCGCCIEGPECITWARLGWVICGGESGTGPRIRPSHPDWFRSLRDQCVEAEVPFLLKQWGAWGPGLWPGSSKHPTRYITADGQEQQLCRDPMESTATMVRLGKHKTGNHLDGKQWLQIPEPAPLPGLFGGDRG